MSKTQKQQEFTVHVFEGERFTKKFVLEVGLQGMGPMEYFRCSPEMAGILMKLLMCMEPGWGRGRHIRHLDIWGPMAKHEKKAREAMTRMCEVHFDMEDEKTKRRKERLKQWKKEQAKAKAKE